MIIVNNYGLLLLLPLNLDPSWRLLCIPAGWGGGCRPNLFQLPWHEQIVEISQPLIQGLRITFAIAKKPCSQATFYSRKGTSLFS
eukprot:s1198_g6.t3